MRWPDRRRVEPAVVASAHHPGQLTSRLDGHHLYQLIDRLTDCLLRLVLKPVLSEFVPKSACALATISNANRVLSNYRSRRSFLRRNLARSAWPTSPFRDPALELPNGPASRLRRHS